MRVLLEVTPRPLRVRGLTVAHGDHEAGSEEEVELAEDDAIRRRVVAGRPVDDAVEVVIGIDLRPLVSADRGILDGKLMQPETLADLAHHVGLRLVQLDPDEVVPPPWVRRRLLERHPPR